MPITEQFKGKPVLVLNPEHRFPFSFGVAKAELIVQNMEAIKAFVAQHKKEESECA